jgi:predicted RecA/RadA family phage recombinase
MAQEPAIFHKDDGSIDYTPVSAVTAGDVVVLNGIVGVAVNDIAASELGAIATKGRFKLPKTTAAWVRGLPVHWDPAGTPDASGATASSGAANQLGVGTYCGICAATADSGDDYGIVDLNAAYPENSNADVTATTGGGTTGLIPASATFVTVTSDSANKQISLPAGYVGKVLRILIGTTGCELISAVAADKVNEVTVGATNELALTAEALYTCVYTKSGFWVVTGLTKLGAAQSALVPDAL